MFLLNGIPLAVDTAFTHNEIQYPANWLRLSTTKEKLELGIIEVPDEDLSFDERFYWSKDIPKDLTDLKTHWTKQIKLTCGSLLSSTDWYIIRKVERNIDVPPSVSTARLAIIDESNRLEVAITNASNVEELKEVVSMQNWDTLLTE